MKILPYVLSCLSVGAIATNAAAHIVLDPAGDTPPRNTGGVSCGMATQAPALLKSGSEHTVAFSVQVLHGDEVVISFAEADDNFTQVLKTLAVTQAGPMSVRVTLPDVACDACTLRIVESGYTSCADVQLTATGVAAVDPNDTVAPMPVSNGQVSAMDSSITLSWSNPTQDFAQVVVVQSSSAINAVPATGAAYALGDALNDGSTVVYSGVAEKYSAVDLALNTRYYFAVFAADASGNYAEGEMLWASTTGVGNNTPSVTLTAMQGDVITTSINPNAGLVYVQAAVSDIDIDDTHSFDWSASDMALIDTDNKPAMFTLDPKGLADGRYSVDITVTDSGMPVLNASNQLTLTVADNSVGGGNGSSSAASVQAEAGSGGSIGWSWLSVLAALVLLRRSKKVR